MKRAKLMLAAIAVMAIVGGTIAAKASKAKRGAFAFCTSTTLTTVPLSTLTDVTTTSIGVKNTYCTLPGSTARIYTVTTILD